MDTVLSIVIPTYKRYDSLFRTLQSVTRYTISSSEIIVVDQSPENKQNAIKAHNYFPLVKYICYNTPGLPCARNVGVKTSKGSIILFLDDDVVVHPFCFYEHVVMHGSDTIDAIAGRIIQMNSMVKWDKAPYVTMINHENGETKGNFDIECDEPVLYATGGHMSIKRFVFKTVGLFNTKFIGNALYEDVEFFSRMRKNGYTIMYNSKAIVYHYPLETGGCHESRGFTYQLERLHNQTLFYLLHIHYIPSINFIRYCKNILEYISRNKNKTYSIYRLIFGIAMILKAYFNALIFTLKGKH